jgi:hypothetical protein
MSGIKHRYEYAQLMRGGVDEYSSDYIEAHLDKEIVTVLWKAEEWTDEEGFTWSFKNVCAKKDEKGIYITYANKACGMGHHETRVYRPESKEHEILYI